MASLSSSGELCVFSFAETDVLIDINGYIDEVSSPSAFAPERFADSRTDGSADTIDGRFEATGRLAAGETWKIDVAGRGTIPEAGTVAALLNVAVINPAESGFLTVFPCDEQRPEASNVNYGPGDIVSNGVLAKLAFDGSVCVFTLAAADVLVDATGVIFGNPTIRD